MIFQKTMTSHHPSGHPSLQAEPHQSQRSCHVSLPAIPLSASPLTRPKSSEERSLSIGVRDFRVELRILRLKIILERIVFIVLEHLKTQFSSWIDGIPGLRDLQCGQSASGFMP